MGKLRNPLLSLRASGSIGRALTFVRRRGRNIVEAVPIPTNADSPPQKVWRPMFSKCIDLWHLLSAAEKQAWESAARPLHMTGYAWFISQCLRPNPGIYLPLQGGTMSGDIDMAHFHCHNLAAPVHFHDAARKVYVDSLEARYQIGARVYHSVNQSIPFDTPTMLAFNSERYDTDNIHDNAVSNSRLTCRTAGKYIIVALIWWAANAAGYRSHSIVLNATTWIGQLETRPLPNNYSSAVVTTIWDMSVGDYVELEVYQNTLTAVNVTAWEAGSPEFMMQRIG